MSEAVVVGGGIGGLAAAVAFLGQGWDVEVLERATEITTVGAGLSLWPNALRALDALGLGDRVRERAVEGGTAGIRDPAGRWLTRMDAEAIRARYGSPIMLHRADLVHILRSVIPADAVRPGVTVTEAGVDGTVVHSAGTSSGDVVVGADGIRSVVRRAMCGEVRPRYGGYTAWRVVVTPHEPVLGMGETWGRGERFGYGALADGRVYCFATANMPAGTPGGGLAELRDRFGGWHEPIPALLAAARESDVLKHDLYDLPALKSFVTGRIALVGDAAHAMMPTLGQGACQALEDAVVLAKAAADGDLTRYDRERMPRTRMIASRSRRLGAAAQLSFGPVVALRDSFVRVVPSSVQLRSLASVLDWSC